MTDDKFLLLKMHNFSHGLSDDVVLEIAEECEFLKLSSGDYLHRVNQPFDSIFLVIHGCVKQTLIDIQGNVLLQHYQTTGGKSVPWPSHHRLRWWPKIRNNITTELSKSTGISQQIQSVSAECFARDFQCST